MSVLSPVDVLQGMYAAYLAGDRASIDTALAQHFTMFDSDSPNLVAGLDQLNEVRAERPTHASAPAPSALTMEHVNVLVRHDTALVTYWLRVDFVGESGEPTEAAHSRNSAWMIPGGFGWQIAHLHEESWSRGPASIAHSNTDS